MKTILVTLLFLTSHISRAQDWRWALCPNDIFSSGSRAVATDGAGNVYLLGDRDSTLTFGSTTLYNSCSRTIFLTKFDSSGTLLWAREIYGKGGDDPVIGGQSLSVDFSGNVCVTGFYSFDTIFTGLTKLIYNGGFGGCNGFLAKYNSLGEELWATNLDGAGCSVGPYNVSIDPSGNIFVCGSFTPHGAIPTSFTLTCDTVTINYPRVFNDMFLVKYSSFGKALWARRSANADDCSVLAGYSDNSGNMYVAGRFSNYYITFGSITLPNSGLWYPADDMFLVKYDYAGNVIWAQVAGSDRFGVSPSSVTTDIHGNVYVAGYSYSDSVNFSSFTLVESPKNFKTWYMFLVKYDSAGNTMWAKAVNDANAITAFITSDNSANLYVTGTDTLQSLFIERYDSSGDNIWALGANIGNKSEPMSLAIDQLANLYITGGFYDKIRFGTTELMDDIPNISSYPYTIPKLFLAKAEFRLKGNLVDDPSKKKTIVYPNPATTSIIISSQSNISQIVITNLIGQTVYANESHDEKVEVNVADLPAGVYLIKINGTDMKRFVRE